MVMMMTTITMKVIDIVILPSRKIQIQQGTMMLLILVCNYFV